MTVPAIGPITKDRRSQWALELKDRVGMNKASYMTAVLLQSKYHPRSYQLASNGGSIYDDAVANLTSLQGHAALAICNA